MEDVIVIIMSAILILGIAAYSSSRKFGFDMLDAYLLMVLLYFGIYSIVGTVANGARGKDEIAVISTFFGIITALIFLCGLYLMLPWRIRSKLIFGSLVVRWSNVEGSKVLLLAALFISFNAYIYNEYGLITYVGAELDNMGINIPNWIGPAKVVMRSFGFCCYVYIIV